MCAREINVEYYKKFRSSKYEYFLMMKIKMKNDCLNINL